MKPDKPTPVFRLPPTSKDVMRPVDKAFIHSVMFELGIVPIEDPKMDMKRGLDTLSAEDSRALKRKFRKLWRKFMREAYNPNVATNTQISATEKILKRRMGVGKKTPSRAERLARKRLVYEKIWHDVVVPMLERFENPDRKPEGEDKKQR